MSSRGSHTWQYTLTDKSFAEYCTKTNEVHRKFLSSLHSFQLVFSSFGQETLIDATLACDGKLFPAHKFVLSMCSEYFKEMFTTNPCKHPIGEWLLFLQENLWSIEILLIF